MRFLPLQYAFLTDGGVLGEAWVTAVTIKLRHVALLAVGHSGLPRQEMMHVHGKRFVFSPGPQNNLS